MFVRVVQRSKSDVRQQVTYFPDLTPYIYGSSARGLLNVGWLDNKHPYTQGPVDARLIEKVKTLATKPVELYMGVHTCELCGKRESRSHQGNGEIRVSRENITYAAPVLIVHYMEKHCYLPPFEFLKAVEEKAC
jgi:hypothetical protein